MSIGTQVFGWCMFVVCIAIVLSRWKRNSTFYRTGSVVLLLAMIALLLTGCAGHPAFTSLDGTGTEQQFYQARYACMQQSQPHGGVAAQGSQNFVVGVMAVSAIVAGSAAVHNYVACMAAAGWVQKGANHGPQ